MTIRSLSWMLATLAIGTGSASYAQQSQNRDVLDYIEKYKAVAVAEQQRTGIPAAITLAQGIHESASGKSELSLNAHNHFGIKCKSTWLGETYTYTDDAKDECFRKYESDLHSYKDHSDFLKNNPRYLSLFSLAQNDYKSWANGLKKCGYATNPKYAQKLIDLIERYDLQQYTVAYEYFQLKDSDGAIEAIASTDKYFGLNNQDTVIRKPKRRTDDGNVFANVPEENETEAPAVKPPAVKSIPEPRSVDYYVITNRNGIKGFYAPQGDLLLNAANKNNIRYAKLLDLNDLADAPLPEDMFIYLGKKNKTGYEANHTVVLGETISIIAQDQGMRMKELLAFNHLLPGEEPAEGTVLYLQGIAPQKPDLSRQQYNTSKYNNIDRVAKNNNEYIATGNAPKYTSEPNDPKMRALQKQEEQKTTEQAATPLAQGQQQEDFNIANEPAVEEQLQAENVGTTTAAATAPEKEMSSLDRLKAKLDKSVYGGTAPAVTTTNNNNANRNNVTPSAVNNNVNKNTPSTAASSIDTKSAHSSLKNKINQHQQEQQQEGYRAQPVVERPNNVVNTAPAPAKHSQSGVHVVKKGETAFGIAKQYGITVDQLVKWNKLPASGSVSLGAKLKVK
ncbi:hypothetical protein DBR32_02595 [Taibaiella sp. KBW10]|uniref:glucosaminidase domain-containing protein n=1 Tax=Taibaiella sp. KBW10 TaxID=2153357 RepID=UPI000F59048E|nr:glucosaminidase domain-containing protein [Taibaiella sp. KBW10]RQO32508.1 hypothetical protein DBR32_02595 [Taibaiella sp. KBW10]